MHGCPGVAGDICFSCVRRCQGRPNVPAMNKTMKLWALAPSLLRTCPHQRHCVAAFPDSVNNPGKTGLETKIAPLPFLVEATQSPIKESVKTFRSIVHIVHRVFTAGIR
jgi:hypothetical protein